MIGSIIFGYTMGAFLIGMFSSMWYDLTRLSAYPKKDKIMDLTLAEWTAMSAVFWPIVALTGVLVFVYTYGKTAVSGPTKIVKKVNTSIVNSIEKRISA